MARRIARRKLLARAAKILSYVSYALRRRHWYPMFRTRQTRFFMGHQARRTMQSVPGAFPDMFVIDVVNHESGPVDLHVRFSRGAAQRPAGVYEETVQLTPGFTHHEIPYRTLVLALGDAPGVLIALTLGNNALATLTFTAKTGVIKGTFKGYSDYFDEAERLQHKIVSVSYAGILVPAARGAALLSGAGHCLVPDNDPDVMQYRLKRSFPVRLLADE